MVKIYNLQGDVVALIDANGTQMVEYGYDARGNPISKSGSMVATIGTLNPFRYRGYVYDEETGLYYLRSRVYNPEWKRFMNADVSLENADERYAHNPSLTECNLKKEIIEVFRMSGYSGWFDPICYQFYFYNVNSIGFAPEMNMAYRSFLEEIKPCCEHWISSSEDLLLKIHDSKDGYLVRKICDLEDVNYSLNSISNIEDQSVDEIKLSLCSSKIPRQFSTPSKDIQPDWKKHVMYYMSCKNWSAIGEKEQREWLYKILNCSSEDLENCCFPSKCFASGSETFVLHHKCISLNGNVAYANEILKESGIEQNKDMFVEYIYVSIPRCLLKHMNLSFDLQDQWKNRLKQLSSTFKISVGGIKADCFRPCRATSLSTINGNYRLGFSERIPDIGWGMCITEKQMNSLNKTDTLFDCLYQVDLLKNGNVYLQLTPSVCMVQVENVQKLWKLFSKKIQLIEYMDYSACEVPNSMQMGIELENLCIDEFGYYSFKI